MSVFRDRRPHAGPRDDDYLTPVNRDSLIEANNRVRGAVPDYRFDDADRSIRTLAVQRHRARNEGRGDFESIGSYLEFLAGGGDAAGPGGRYPE